jgi:hypothetical protein
MQEFPSEGFVEKFKTKSHEYLGGDELLWSLKLRGCGLDFILIFVELHCGGKIVSPTRQSISAHSAGEHSQADNLADLARRLTIMSNKVEATNKEIAGWLARHGQKPFGLPGEIRSYVSLVQAISKDIRDVSLRSAPMDALNLLADCMIVTEADFAIMVKDLEELQQKDLEEQPKSAQRASVIAARTARIQRMKESIDKINYEDLALLLEIGYSAYGTNKTVDIEAVKNLVERARDRRMGKSRADRTPLKSAVYTPDFDGREVS